MEKMKTQIAKRTMNIMQHFGLLDAETDCVYFFFGFCFVVQLRNMVNSSVEEFSAAFIGCRVLTLTSLAGSE